MAIESILMNIDFGVEFPRINNTEMTFRGLKINRNITR